MTNRVEYRGYFFTNYYLSSIQHGIQSAHCLGKLCINYLLQEYVYAQEGDILKQYLTYDNTKIILNGGNHDSLQKLKTDISDLADKLNLPSHFFHEDHQSLNKTLTCVGIIVPDTIYTMDLTNKTLNYDMNMYGPIIYKPDGPSAEEQLARIIQSHHLAR